MTDRPKPEQDPQTGRFLSGNSGNGGRHKGNRNKLGEAFLADMFTDWEQHGAEAIERVRAEKPEVYLKVIASLVPRNLNLNMNPLADQTDEELIQRLKALMALVGPEVFEDDDEPTFSTGTLN